MATKAAWVRVACEHCDGAHQRHRIVPVRGNGYVENQWQYYGWHSYEWGWVCPSCRRTLEQWDREEAKAA